MKKVFTLIFVLILFSTCKVNKTEKLDIVKNGSFDVKNLSASQIIDLIGDWIFIPNDFVNPKADFLKYTRYENINQNWSTYNDNDDEIKFGTYALRIKNLIPNAVYAIAIPGFSSASIAYLNGREIFKAGQIAREKKYEQFNWSSKLLVLPTLQLKEATLVIHISNFNDRIPCSTQPIKFGFYHILSNYHKNNILKQTITAGILVVVGILFISLYIFYPQGISALYFGLICVIFSIRICSYDEYIIKSIMPNLTGIALFKVGYLTLSLEIIFCTLFLNEFFVKVNKKILGVILAPMAMYSLINIFTPILMSATLLFPAQIYLVFMAIYNLVIIIIEACRKNKTAYFFLASMTVFILLTARDILVSNGFIAGPFLAHFGVFVLLLPMSIIILKRFKNTSEQLIEISAEIEETNKTLEKFVPYQFMNFLNKRHFEIKLGDNVLKDMYISFIHLGISSNLTTDIDRLNFLKIYNKTLAEINPIITKHSGFIDKYLTEGLMVIFYGSGDNVIKCLLEIKELIKRENIERSINELPKINLASGIHYGKIMIGTIGEETRMDSTVISDTVNIASRLHFYAIKKNTNIFITETVKSLLNSSLKNNFSYIYNGLVKFRGKEKPIPVYEVMTNDA